MILLQKYVSVPVKYLQFFSSKIYTILLLLYLYDITPTIFDINTTLWKQSLL